MSAIATRDLDALEARLGYRFVDRGLLETALRHASRANEDPPLESNERLEFLGDSVVGLVVAHRLYAAHPDWPEGDLTRGLHQLVDTRSLANLAERFGLADALELGRTEQQTGGSRKQRVLANAMEAVLAAIFLDGGLSPVDTLVGDAFAEAFQPNAARTARDPKTALQEETMARWGELPRYEHVSDSGLEGDEARFAAEVRVADGQRCGGVGRSKRAAERAAAEQMLARWEEAVGEDEAPPDAEVDENHRSGIVALLGPPNAGKSTLLNAILGAKLAIVTAKPQTTRSRILGIHSMPGAQIVFIDTPGLHQSEKLLGQVLNEAVAESARDAELALVLVDRSRGWTAAHDAVAQALRAAGTPALVVGSKLDLVGPEADAPPGRPAAPWPPAQAAGLLDGGEGAEADAVEEGCLSVSARTGEGVEALLDAIVSRLPESPPLYPEDDLTDRPVRWLAAELVREVVFEELDQELPYGMAVEVVAFDESAPDSVRIRANLLVVRDSQKRIVIGSGGQQIKRIGVRARREIEALLETRVHLDLWVKVDPRWAKKKKRIEELGYG